MQETGVRGGGADGGVGIGLALTPAFGRKGPGSSGTAAGGGGVMPLRPVPKIAWRKMNQLGQREAHGISIFEVNNEYEMLPPAMGWLLSGLSQVSIVKVQSMVC